MFLLLLFGSNRKQETKLLKKQTEKKDKWVVKVVTVGLKWTVPHENQREMSTF